MVALIRQQFIKALLWAKLQDEFNSIKLHGAESFFRN
jgi:hypothetical protein